MINFNDNLFTQLPLIEDGVETLHLLLTHIGSKDSRDEHDLLGHVLGGALLTPEGEWQGGSDIWNFYIKEGVDDLCMAQELYNQTGDDTYMEVFNQAESHILPRCIEVVKHLGGRQAILKWSREVLNLYRLTYR